MFLQKGPDCLQPGAEQSRALRVLTEDAEMGKVIGINDRAEPGRIGRDRRVRAICALCEHPVSTL
jgi:hypothetical protein